jgi:uncharacterized membrane protein
MTPSIVEGTDLWLIAKILLSIAADLADCADQVFYLFRTAFSVLVMLMGYKTPFRKIAN